MRQETGKKNRAPKADNIVFRIEREEKRELEERLAMSGLGMSEYIRRLIMLDKKEGYVCKY